MNPGHTPDEGEKAVTDVLDGLKDKPVDAKELEKAKNQEISGFILGRDTDEEKAVALAEAAVIGKNPDLVNTELGRYLTVTPADIRARGEAIFCAAARDRFVHHAAPRGRDNAIRVSPRRLIGAIRQCFGQKQPSA